MKTCNTLSSHKLFFFHLLTFCIPCAHAVANKHGHTDTHDITVPKLCFCVEKSCTKHEMCFIWFLAAEGDRPAYI